jgi:hypothetical protein
MKPAILKPQVSIGDVLIGDNIENYPTRQFQHEDEVEGEVFRYFRFSDSTVSAFTRNRITQLRPRMHLERNQFNWARILAVRCDGAGFSQ